MYRPNQPQKLSNPPQMPHIRPIRLVRVPAQISMPTQETAPTSQRSHRDGETWQWTADHTTDLGQVSIEHLTQMSGIHKGIRVTSRTLDNAGYQSIVEEEWWPDGIQRMGPFSVMNLYGEIPFGYSRPSIPVTDVPVLGMHLPASHGTRIVLTNTNDTIAAVKTWLRHPLVKLVLGSTIGLGLLFLIAIFIDMASSMALLKKNLTTPHGIALALLSGLAFLTAFSVRGIRWKLFVRPLGYIQTYKAIQLFLIGAFLNFVLPIRGGEVSKCIMLRHLTGIPISRSLPTVAMDKVLDLMPTLFIIAIVPTLGIPIDLNLWLVLATVGGLQLALIFLVLLAIWKHNLAIELIQRITGLLPGQLGRNVENFAAGFVDALLAGASQPTIFVPAIFLTLIAVLCDGLFTMLAFWTIGYPIPFGIAIFGYAMYNLFYIFPTPPGQIGSNEAIGLLVFSGLLHLNAQNITAMFFFSHPWTALLMTLSGFSCLIALGFSISEASRI